MDVQKQSDPDLDAEIKQLKTASRYGTGEMLRIMHILRHRCPWDREQTHESIRKNFIEECYEACEAIDRHDAELLREELGDVMLQVAFHCEMEAERGTFCWDDVCDGLCRKLILRHPHVFGELNVADSGEVLKNWEQIKHVSKEHLTGTERLRAVASTLPALMRAQKVQKRAADAGVDRQDAEHVISNIYNGAERLQKSLNVAEKDWESSRKPEIEAFFRGLLFECVRLGRKLGIDCEETLNSAAVEFTERFARAEDAASASETDISEISDEDAEKIWHFERK